jgi:predicted esterase
MDDYLETHGVWGRSFPRCLLAATTLSLALLAAVGAGTVREAKAGQVRYLDRVFSRAKVQHDLVYGRADGKSLKLDLYQPAGDTARGRPVLIFAHGGGFKGGDKGASHNVALVDDFARRGWVATSINFRIDGVEREATDDLQASVRWFRAHAGRYRIDPARIAVMGASSGAISALNANFNPEDAGSSGNPGYSSRVAAGLSISGTARDRQAIDPGDPPIAMFHAVNDTVVPFSDAQSTCTQTRVMGNVCDFYAYQDGGHPPGFMVAHNTEIVEQSSAFLCRRTRACAPTSRGLDSAPRGTRRRDSRAPVVSRARAVPKRFAVDPAARSVVPTASKKRQKGRRRARRGTTFRYRLSERARTVFSIRRRLTGRRKGRGTRCAKPTRQNRNQKKCTRLKLVLRFAHRGVRGKNSVRFSGRSGRRRLLRPGRYRVTVVARDAAGNKSKRRVFSFRIVKR